MIAWYFDRTLRIAKELARTASNSFRLRLLRGLRGCSQDIYSAFRIPTSAFWSVIARVFLGCVLLERFAQFRRVDDFDVRGPFADFSFEFRVDPYAHGKEQPAVVGDAELLCAVPEVFLHVIGDFGIEKELDGFFRAAAVDAEAVLEDGFDIERFAGLEFAAGIGGVLIRKRAKVCGSSSGTDHFGGKNTYEY